MQEKNDYLTRSKLGLRRREDCLMQQWVHMTEQKHVNLQVVPYCMY